MKSVLLLLAATALLAAAFSPRDRRAMPDAELGEAVPPATTTPPAAEFPTTINSASNVHTKCAPLTPCAWAIYKVPIKLIELNLTNTYCVCAAGQTCIWDEDDTSARAYVYRCRTVIPGKPLPGPEEYTT